MERLKNLWKTSRRGKLIILVVGAVVFLLLIQLIPVPQTNPKIVLEPVWDSPRTRELAKVSCFDCHSNETTYPWYDKIAPMSWLVWNDVTGGRRTFNFSDWGHSHGEVGNYAEAINSGRMPPSIYTLIHPNAKLSSSEKQELITGLMKTFAQTPGGIGTGGGRD